MPRRALSTTPTGRAASRRCRDRPSPDGLQWRGLRDTVGFVEPAVVGCLLGPAHKIGGAAVLWGQGRVVVLLTLIVACDLRHNGRNLFRLDLLLGENAKKNQHLLFGRLRLAS